MCLLFRRIDLNFLIAGHTKFSPDRHFGYAKSKLNAAESCETISDAAQIIENSAVNQKVIITRNLMENKPTILMYDWKRFLCNRYRKAPPNKSYSVVSSSVLKLASQVLSTGVIIIQSRSLLKRGIFKSCSIG